MSLSADGRSPLYEDTNAGLAFYDNPRDHPDGFDVLVGKNPNVEDRGHVYVPSRCLDDLTRGGLDASLVVGMLDNLTGGNASFLLRENRISLVQMHEALLQVKIAYLNGRVNDLLRSQE